MLEGLIAWAVQLTSIFGFTVALGAPMPVAQVTALPPADSSVLGATTIAPPPLQQPGPVTPPVVVEPEPIKPAPVEPPVVKPVKPIKPIYCLHRANDGSINAQIRYCGCDQMTPDPKPTASSPTVYPCRYHLDEDGNQ